jgi:invasion protein IalB
MKLILAVFLGLMAGAAMVAPRAAAATSDSPDDATPSPALRPTTPSGSTPAAAPNGGATATKYGSWSLLCGPPNAKPAIGCALVQQITEKLSRRTVFIWSLRPDDKGQLQGFFTVPPGVFTNRGLIMKTAPDAAGVRVDYERCNQRLCRAVFAVNKDLLKQLSAVKSVSVTVALTNGQNVNVDLPMDGFANGVQALAAQSKPASP